MANETLNLGDVYPENKENQEITLQFGDFGSVIIEDADDAAQSVISLDAETRMGQDISSDMSATRSAAEANVSSPSVPSVQPNDIPIYSTHDLLLILQYSRTLVDNRQREVPLLPVKQETPAPLVALITTKLEPTSPLPMMQSTITAGVNSRNVSKKDFCVLNLETTRLLKEMKFTINSSGKNTYEKMDQLFNILENIGIIPLIKSQRRMPVITDLNPLGFRESKVIYRPLSSMSDMSKNQFLDDQGEFDPKSWTRIIALSADDIVCFQSDLNVLKTVINTVFDDQLRLFALALMKEGKIVEAFQSLILKVRGKQQEDINLARDNLNKFTQFDMAVEIDIGMNALVKLFSAVHYATGVALTEDELKRKFHECVFNDDRLVMHNTVLESISKMRTYQETVDTLYDIMKLLPIDKQKISGSNSLNAITTGKSPGGGGSRKRYCYAFQLNKCVTKGCKFLHEIDPEATERAKLYNKSEGTAKSDKTDKKDKGTRNGKPKDKDKYFNVNLSSADRQFFGAPRGEKTPENPAGWSKGQRHSIHAVIASDQSRQGAPRVDRSVHFNQEPAFDPSPDALYDQYANAFHHQSSTGSTPRARLDNSTAPAFSHYLNSFRVIPKYAVTDDGDDNADA
jgi:hypothetical protein